MNDAQQHYDAEYSNETSDYRIAYDKLPEWAVAVNGWHVDFVIALLGLKPERGPVLDLGSGMGHYLSAWERRGFETRGIEISEVAIRKSKRHNIDLGDATDLSRYKEREFQLVFSAAFLEHVPDDSVRRLVADELRVAAYAAHFIAHDAGKDPGHINIKSPAEWLRFFDTISRDPTFVLANNPVCPVQPAFLHVQRRMMPPHLRHSLDTYHQKFEVGVHVP